MPDTCAPSRTRTGRLITFGFGAIAALAYLIIGIVRGQPWGGVAAAVVLVGYSAVLWFTRNRSEASYLLGGAVEDERQAQVTRRALAFTAQIMITVVVVGTIATFASDSEAGSIFAGMSLVGGASFLGSMVWISRRG